MREYPLVAAPPAHKTVAAFIATRVAIACEISAGVIEMWKIRGISIDRLTTVTR